MKLGNFETKNNDNDEQNIVNILSCTINMGWNTENTVMWYCFVTFGVTFWQIVVCLVLWQKELSVFCHSLWQFTKTYKIIQKRVMQRLIPRG
jgi:hypothetical protein